MIPWPYALAAFIVGGWIGATTMALAAVSGRMTCEEETREAEAHILKCQQPHMEAK